MNFLNTFCSQSVFGPDPLLSTLLKKALRRILILAFFGKTLELVEQTTVGGGGVSLLLMQGSG
jgi:hypothetical protein